MTHTHFERRSVRDRLLALLTVALFTLTVLPSVSVSPVAAADPVVEPERFLGPKATGQTAGGVTTAGIAPTGFTDSVVWSTGLTNPTAIRFASDGRVFIAEKSGLIKIFSSLTDPTPSTFADLRGKVHDYWDRGLLGMTLDPNFPASPYVYVMYALDAAIGATPPRWNDVCPSPPGPTTDGCVIGARLSRLTAVGDAASSTETVLIEDWCQQWPSHTIGELRFGPDGALYASSGDGASFSGGDWGQWGGSSGSPIPKNPCGDPPVPVGGTQTAPTARGGALRSQSVRRPAGEPRTLDGTMIRVDPATGLALPTNPLAGSSDVNARRVVGYGLRNPFRFTFRPGTNELWVGDVGWNNVEEINRFVNPLSSTLGNAGWPCYEGTGRQSVYDQANLDMCESLYTTPTGLLSPYYAYDHTAKVVAGETCPTGSSAITGIAFYQGGPYPPEYDGALFFADHSRNCIWAMKAGTNGLPNPATRETFVAAASNPVALEIGPGGDLFYVDMEGGDIRRISYAAGNQAPTAVIGADPTSGPSPLTVDFDGTGSSDPDGDTLTYAWDLDGDGQYDDSTSATPSFTYSTAGSRTVRLRVTDPGLLTGTTTQVILVDDALPVPVIDTPSGSLTWRVGDPISFTGHATDGQGANLPASALTWSLELQHCPSNCHTHTVQTWNGVAGGSFAAPDHEYPSFLRLVLTATSPSGTASTTLDLQPQTVDLTFASVPTGLSLSVGTQSAAATPFTRTAIVGSGLGLIAAPVQSLGGSSYAFTSWSDGGAASHSIVAPASPTTYTATYTQTGSTTSFLSDLPYTVTANGWGPVEKDKSNGENAAGSDGLPITIGGVVFAKGLGTHAVSDVRYTMSGCTSFTATVGVDDEVGNLGTVVFEVWADGTKLYDSGVRTGTSANLPITVDVTGRTALQLLVTNGGDDINYDHGDWADAKLTCAS